MARRQLTLDNSVAAELAGSEDTVLRALRGKLEADLHLRGNVLTLEGEPDDVAAARRNGWQLVSLDIRDLVSKGLAVTPAAAVYP